MRREIALMLLLLVVAQGCATGRLARQPVVTGGGPADLEAVNRALEDQPAIVELKSGERVHDVEGVKMTAESTSWRDGDQVRTVPTAEVSRVTRQVRWRAAKGLAWGAVGGLPVALLINNNAVRSRRSNNQGVVLVLAELGSAALGMFIAGAVRLPPDRVVYKVATARAAAATGGSGSRHCRLAADPAPPASPAIECAPAAATP